MEIAFNSIHDFGLDAVLSDFGGVYISTNSDAKPSTNWLAAEVHHNLIVRGRAYNYGSNGLYNDHGTSGPAFHSNAVANVGGRAVSLHCGNNVSVVNNVFYNVSSQPFACSSLPCPANCAVSGCNGAGNPGLSGAVFNNIVSLDPSEPTAFTLKDVVYKPPGFTVSSDANVFFAGQQGVVFPKGGSGDGQSTDLDGWRSATGNDRSSVEGDPLFAAPESGNFSLLSNSPAWALGWKVVDLSQVGIIPV